MFAKPVNSIQKLVESLSKQLKNETYNHEKYDKVRKNLNIPKFMMFSGHDSTVAPAWDFLNPSYF